MSRRESTEPRRVLRSREGASETGSLELIREEPLLIRVDGKPYAVVMRTPGGEPFHAAGFCLGEGIASSPDDLERIDYDEQTDPDAVDIWLKPERRGKVGAILERTGFISQTSCGICGKELLEDIYQRLSPAGDGFVVDADRVLGCIDRLSENQRHYRTTRGSHAALLFDGRLEEMSFAEDVGRHNALDKAIGKAFLEGTLPEARLVVLSSRNSYELVQKAARAHLQVVISISRPTALAAEMGKALNMTLAFPARESELVIVCGEQRITRA